jgi:hypothetical protein
LYSAGAENHLQLGGFDAQPTANTSIQEIENLRYDTDLALA